MSAPAKPSLVARALRRLGLQKVPAAPSGARSVFAGAHYSRLTEDWITTILSADQEIKGDLRRLRGAARMLARDNAYGKRFLKLVERNVIGAHPQGIQLQVRLGTTRGGVNAGVSRRTEEAWALWGEPETCDVTGRLSWADLQRLVIRSVAQDGEALIRIVEGADNPFGFALQMLDVDLLDGELSAESGKSPTGNEIRMGVEVDRWQKPVAYWLLTSHPSETNPHRRREHERVPATEVIHLYLVDRPGQTRGVPWFAPVMLDQKMLGGFLEAAVTAARIGASKMYAITYDAEKGGLPVEPEAGERTVVDDVAPGQGLQLIAGESIQPLDWQYPSDTVDPFTKAILKSIAAGLDVAYSSLTGDLREVNYSSIRAGLLDERDAWRALQGWVVTHLSRRVYRRWLPFAALAGYVPATMVASLQSPIAQQWQPRGWAWVDPLKEVEANARAVQEGFTTRSKVCAEMGGDFEDNIERLGEEVQHADSLGVKLGAPEDQEAETDGEPNDGDVPSRADRPTLRAIRANTRALRLARAAGDDRE